LQKGITNGKNDSGSIALQVGIFGICEQDGRKVTRPQGEGSRHEKRPMPIAIGI